MQIDNRLVSSGGADGYGTLGSRTVTVIGGETRDTVAGAAGVSGGFDPSSRVSLSVDAMLYLSRTRRSQDKYPALTKDEWSNKLTPQLAAREYQAFGKYSETGDYKAYYTAFMNYYDNLRPEDQNSLRYFGTRDAAMAGLRSAEYSGESGDEEGAFQTIVSVLLDRNKQAETPVADTALSTVGVGSMFGWEAGMTVVEPELEPAASVSEIEKLYLDTF